MPDQLIDEYLMRLDNASVFLVPARRQELREEIVEHIDAALENAEDVNSAVVLEILDRLGPPADIVAVELASSDTSEATPEPLRQNVSESEDGGVTVHSPPRRRRVLYVASGFLTLVSVVLLTFFVVSGMHDPGQPVESTKNSTTVVPSESDHQAGRSAASPEPSNESTFRPDESSSSPSGPEEPGSPSPT